jgi:hypothetical protein
MECYTPRLAAAALKWLNDRHKLNLTDHYIRSAFREADADFSQSLNYDEFLASFAGGLLTGPTGIPMLAPQGTTLPTLCFPWFLCKHFAAAMPQGL